MNNKKEERKQHLRKIAKIMEQEQVQALSFCYRVYLNVQLVKVITLLLALINMAVVMLSEQVQPYVIIRKNY